ncbi:cytochrome P450 [Streptomyces sp. NPDC058812]|uniref:cytochrome P450 n=1 Tax=unclassified Streptomyces TaxID=2593676 RepID=UPI0036C048E5
MSSSAELPRLPFARPDGLSIPPRVHELRKDGPLHRVLTPAGDEAWFAVGHDVVKQLFADKRLGRAHPNPEEAARVSDSAWLGGPAGNYETEETDHTRMRDLLQPYFSPRRMRTLRPRIEVLVDDLLDEMEDVGQPANLHELVAFPLPALVICEMLGVPAEDRSLIREWSDGISDMADQRRSSASLAALYDYMSRLTGKKRESGDPGDDLIAVLCAAEGGTLDDDYITYLAMMTVFAGHETTVTSIDLGVLLLLTNPAQHQALLDDIDLVPSAVDEILRASAHAEAWALRYAREDIDIAGMTIRAGDCVLLERPGADRDESAHVRPDEFDVRRSPNPHLAFGYGPRYCMGAPLARLELEVLFSRLVPRFPRLRPAVPVEEMTIRRGLLTAGFHEVPVNW